MVTNSIGNYFLTDIIDGCGLNLISPSYKDKES